MGFPDRSVPHRKIYVRLELPHCSRAEVCSHLLALCLGGCSCVSVTGSPCGSIVQSVEPDASFWTPCAVCVHMSCSSLCVVCVLVAALCVRCGSLCRVDLAVGVLLQCSQGGRVSSVPGTACPYGFVFALCLAETVLAPCVAATPQTPLPKATCVTQYVSWLQSHLCVHSQSYYRACMTDSCAHTPTNSSTILLFTDTVSARVTQFPPPLIQSPKTWPMATA